MNSATKAKEKYNKAHYDRISFYSAIGTKALLKHFAQVEEKSVSKFILDVLVHHVWKYHYDELIRYLTKQEGFKREDLPPRPPGRQAQPPQQSTIDKFMGFFGL